MPVRRVRKQRVVLTGGQIEILAAADSRRTVAELARDLGRTTYGCLQAVRELTEAGLVEPPGREQSSRVTAPAGHVPSVPVPRAPAPRATPILGPAPSDPKPPLLLPLRRRSRQIVPVIEADRWEQVDVNLLVRVRAGLEELE